MPTDTVHVHKYAKYTIECFLRRDKKMHLNEKTERVKKIAYLPTCILYFKKLTTA